MKTNKKQSKIWTIIKHEYLAKVKTKGFIIGTLLGPILMLAIIAIPVTMALLSQNSFERKIAIVDRTGKIGKGVIAGDTAKFFMTELSEDSLKTLVREEKLDGYLFIPENFIEEGKASVYTPGGGGIAFVANLNSKVKEITREIRLKEAGADPKVIAFIESDIEIQTQKVTEKGIEKDNTEASAVIGYILGFMNYMLMFIYGSFVMRGVIEEKANRIIEVLASSAKPYQIMMGKIVGIGAVGLTQVALWIIILFLIMSFGSTIIHHFVDTPNLMQQAQSMNQMGQMGHSGLPANFEIPQISPWVFVAFIFYFLSGYFLFATLFAAVGSAVDQESDAQQLQTPVSMLIVIPILCVSYVMSNPDGTLSIVLSLIPFFSPIIMMVRIAATPVPLWQISVSVVLMIASYFGSVWVASKIYRVGILMYGKKPSFKDIFKWIRLAK